MGIREEEKNARGYMQLRPLENFGQHVIEKRKQPDRQM